MRKAEKLKIIFDALRKEVHERKTSKLEKILGDNVISDATKLKIFKIVKNFTEESANCKELASCRKHLKNLDRIEKKYIHKEDPEIDVLSELGAVTLDSLPPGVEEASNIGEKGVFGDDIWGHSSSSSW